MKKTGLLLLLLTTAAWAQSASNTDIPDAPQGTSPTSATFPTQRVQTPTYADLYCAGFINKQTLPDANFVAAGLQTPSTTNFFRGYTPPSIATRHTPAPNSDILRALPAPPQ